ncbi:MAG: hypothetical protein JNK00_13710 [Flavipsychrobacter sp.]|nr:hypothetical protein [Flavipsychrobacter sp.]
METIGTRLREDMEGFGKDFESFSARNLTLTDAGIGLDRKTLYSWKKHGLLPYAGQPSTKGQNKTWGRFSFIELCWLKMLMEFRQVGLGLDKLHEIKEAFFSTDFIEQFFSKPVDNLDMLSPETIQIAHEKQLIKDGKVQIKGNTKAALEQIQFSLFSCVLYAIMLTRGNYVFYANGKGKFDIVNLNQLIVDPIAGVMDFMDLLNTESVVFVNIKKIIADLSGTHTYFSNPMPLNHRLSEDSVNQLKTMFQDGQVKEVTLRVSENGRPLIWIKRAMKIEELEKEVRSIRKKGKYCDLAVKTRNGEVQYFEQTEILKL